MEIEQQSHADYPVTVASESESRSEERRKRRYSHHRCPRCRMEALQRKRISFYLRPIRLVPGLRPKAYLCDNCNKRIILWRPEGGD